MPENQRQNEVKQPQKQSEPESPREGIETGGRIYWAIAAGHRIANFVEEKRSGGKIIQNESSLVFKNHIYIAHHKKEQGFIENSRDYVNGKVRRVETVKEAQMLTELQKARTQREVTAEFTHTGNQPIPESHGV